MNRSTGLLTTSVCVFVLPFATGFCHAEDHENEAGLLPRGKRVMTREEQKALKPEEVLKLLKAGNRKLLLTTRRRKPGSRALRWAA